MKDTTWCGIEQAMVWPDGVQKGLRTVLEERGVDMYVTVYEKRGNLEQNKIFEFLVSPSPQCRCNATPRHRAW
jgi:hypothetical protein